MGINKRENLYPPYTECIVESAYRYSVRNNKLIIMHGQIIRAGRDTIWFESDDSHRRRAPKNEGEVLHSAVWLRENDVEKAKRILFDYFLKQYNKHRETTIKYYNAMQLLQEQNN